MPCDNFTWHKKYEMLCADCSILSVRRQGEILYDIKNRERFLVATLLEMTEFLNAPRHDGRFRLFDMKEF